MKGSEYYQHRLKLSLQQYELANRHYKMLGSLRLLFFICSALSVYILWGESWLLAPFIFFLILFLWMVNKSANAKYKRDKQKKLIEINEEELNVLAGNWLHFKEGNEYKDPKHAFALDMDLFGKKSIFQLLNRTVSKKGSDLLADQLLYGTTETEKTNEAIKCFSENMDWCQEFLAEGMVLQNNSGEKPLHTIKHVESPLSPFHNLLRFSIPVLTAVFTSLYGFDVISGASFGVYISAVLVIIGKNLKRTNQVTALVTSYAAQVKMLHRQLQLYKSLDIKSEIVRLDRDTLFAEKEGLLDSLIELERIQQRMDYRMNLLVGFVLNIFLAWDLFVLNQWEKWRMDHGASLEEWENRLGQLEVWISGAVYHFNFPNTTFSTFRSDETIRIKGLGHPFVAREKRILNDVALKRDEHFVIITGPNMAGKSTYLRSLGLVFICANAGFPVLADECEIPHLQLYSSMRTTDDLTVESSYFHAELTRLRFIMDEIESGKKVFVILDEILKGTNSKDKEIGSAKFLMKLRRLSAKGVIATHDLSLCELAREDRSFKNMYFDSTIAGKELFFDYKIREGICQNMNASFLLKQMNLVD